jgi:hypothetical protein
MCLVDLIRGKSRGAVATATSAPPATGERRTAATVATVESVTVAATPSQKVAHLALVSQMLPSPTPCPADLAERAALIAEGNECDRAEADRRALECYGFCSCADLADAHAAEIRVALDRLPQPVSDLGYRLRDCTLLFVLSRHFPIALECGWSLPELFGIASMESAESMGLVPLWALWCWPHCLESITEDAAVIRARSGGEFVHHRFGLELDGAPVWWQNPQIVVWD